MALEGIFCVWAFYSWSVAVIVYCGFRRSEFCLYTLGELVAEFLLTPRFDLFEADVNKIYFATLYGIFKI